MAVKKEKNDFTALLANNFKNCQNPPNYKEAIVAKVITVEPLNVFIESEKITLKEGKNLLISEGFRFRCNIDKTTALSVGVLDDLESAKAVTEFHSYGGAPCGMPNAIEDLANAITKINLELLAYKCDLKAGDYVIICPTEINEKYIAIEKVL